MLKKDEIDSLLLQYLLDELNQETRKSVEAWIQEQPEHLQYFKSFRATHIRLRQSLQSNAIRGNYSVWQKKIHRKLFIRNLSRIAAILTLFIGSGLALFWISQGLNHEDTPLAQTSVHPGSSQAILHLSSGQSYNLNDQIQKIKEQDGTTIALSADGSLNYTPASGQQSIPELFNRLEIPRGGEFKLTLADGTEVWLNSESELLYTSTFSGKERIVQLQGEAYFKVAKNNQCPFIVKVGEMAIKVYGTQFNVNTQNKDKIETVLVNGSVSIIYQDQETHLSPEQKAIFDTTNGNISIEETEVLPYIAWKDGNFVFHNETLESIMEKLARWYDLKIFYAYPEKKNIHLSGILERYRNVDELFHHFEKISAARFTMQGQTVIIK